MGLPYINITVSETNGQLSKVSATQKRFLADRTMSYDETESPFRWGFLWINAIKRKYAACF